MRPIILGYAGKPVTCINSSPKTLIVYCRVERPPTNQILSNALRAR